MPDAQEATPIPALSVDRNLLFGLLALQNALIDQDQLLAAFQAWTRDKDRALAEHLTALGHLDGAARAAIEAMAALHSRKYGEAEQSLAAFLNGRSTRESLAGLGDTDIDNTLARIPSGSVPSDGEAVSDHTATYSVGTATGDGQRFRVLRPHARGGLGAVFVAQDTEVPREVALKQILETHAEDEASRQRFLLEAEITGGLEHPGIVPVYGLGTYADGRPYYAMRFIRGDNLKEAIERFHTSESSERDAGGRSLELHKLLRRFIDVCNAIDYAHSRGVLHRDIKPGNIIVGKHGETLVVDWGLAKVTGRSDPSADERTLRPSSSSGSAETLPGSALGTPAFMSPEQARGEHDRLGPRSDVYSLGATLYCLLTGRPPFEGGVADVLHAVRQGKVRPLRQVDSTIDAALEAICLKAMAVESEHRYDSCQALADDIERWMADEPVTAWREPLARTMLRWLTRHRTAVTGAAAAVLVGVVGLVAVLAVQAAANSRLSDSLARETNSNKALNEANAKLTRSQAAVQARYDLAVAAIKTFHTGVSKDFLVKQVQFKSLRDNLLSSAADFYGKLAALLGKETDPASRRALAASNYELAELTRVVGRKEAALAAHRSVLAAREALADELRGDDTAKVEVSQSLLSVAMLLDTTGKPEEAVKTCRRAESLLESLADDVPTKRAALADCRSRIGWFLFGQGQSADALAAYQRVRPDQEALAAAPGASDDTRRELAETVNRIGLLLYQMARTSEAERELSAAIALYQGLADKNPKTVEYTSEVAGCRSNRGWMLAVLGRPAEAEAELRKAVALQQQAVDDNPAVSEFRSRLATTQIAVGALMSDLGRTSDAEKEWRVSMGLLQRLVDDNPTVPDFRFRLACAQHNVAQALSQSGRSSGAQAEYSAATAHFQKLVDNNPQVPDYRHALASALSNSGGVILPLGRAAEARERCERAVRLGERLIQESPTNQTYHRQLAISLRVRGLASRALGDPAGAAADSRRAIGLYEAMPSRSGEEWFETAICRAMLADLGGVANSTVTAAEGRSEADAAMALLRKALAMGYRNVPEILEESGFKSLHARSDYQLLIMDLVMPTDPFSAAK